MNPTPTNAAAPHGGTWIQTETGFIEISVFETGVPPHFRLYFFDAEQRPQPPVAEATVTIETIRPDGAKQVFAFVPEPGCLRSTSDIPEPHEFRVQLTLLLKEASHLEGKPQVYETQFTEAGHGHSHGPGGHAHDHGGGIVGWFKGTFAHSHSIEDKVDETMESNERGIGALKISLIMLLVTSFIQVAIVFYSGSVALLADTIHNFGDATTSIPLWIAFALTQRGVSKRFTYGYGKTEDVAGVVIVGVIFFSACVAAYESVMKIIHPQPITHLGAVAIAALVGFIGNEAVAVIRLKVGREIESAALIADGQHARVDGFTSLAVLLGVVGVWAGYPIVDPLVGILITIAILFIVKDATKAVWNRMIDGIEPEIVHAIETVPLYVNGVRAVHQVRARWVGHKVFTDLHVTLDPALSVGAAHQITDEVEAVLKNHVRSFGGAVVHICPEEKVVSIGSANGSALPAASGLLASSPIVHSH